MGLKRWIARKGAVGSTARWAAKGYWVCKKQNPDQSINEIMAFLVEARYQGGGTKAVRESLIRIIEKGQVKGLAHLVTNILSIEAGYQENTADNRNSFSAIIMDELRECDIPEEHIYDLSHMNVAMR